jgi:hypothetical protein
MTNRICAIFLVICGFGMAAAVVYADVEKGDYVVEELGNLRQPGPVKLSPDSNYQVTAYPLYVPDLVPGDGVQDVRSYCNTCHSPRFITMQPPLPADTWEAEVNKMGKAFGAQIPDESKAKIISYLQAHYTEVRKR